MVLLHRLLQERAVHSQCTAAVQMSRPLHLSLYIVLLIVVTSVSSFEQSFTIGISKPWIHTYRRTMVTTNPVTIRSSQPKKFHQLYGWKMNGDNSDEETKQLIEETRIKVLQSRRQQIRQTLQAAERLRNFRISNGYTPEIDVSTGKPIKEDGKVAVSLTAFVVTVGAIVLRVGGRAALVSAVGLDFLSDSPELKENLEYILQTADTMDVWTKGLLFTAGWTAVKVLCFDAGGVILALASGILFGGVIPGAIASATAATIGSTVAFTMAKIDSPIRTKALSLLEEYPSLRGIERVVARDGVKAVLTLRLAPVLPIPIGMYSYIYGVTNVPVAEFMSGIFLGSLKPYLLDSYIGYFGKEIVQGMDVTDGGLQDYLLLGALGISILIGVFASQLASETWDSVIQEVEAEQQAKNESSDEVMEETDGVVRNIFGLDVPDWIVGFQLGIQAANERISELIVVEHNAQVWNYTNNVEGSKRKGIPLLPAELDPAKYVNSPERQQINQGLDFGQDFCNGLVLSPLLFTTFLKYADPLYDAENDKTLQPSDVITILATRPLIQEFNSTATDTRILSVGMEDPPDAINQREVLLNQLNVLRSITEQRISDLDDKLRQK